MEALRNLEAISATEYEEQMRRKTAASGSFLDQLRYGLGLAKKEAGSFGQMWIKIGESLPDKISGGLTDALLDFAEGTKTAKQAFQDFAKSTIKWLAEIIIKQMLLNAISGYFSGSGSGGIPNYGSYNFVRPVSMHKGGIAGEPPIKKFHTGGVNVAPNEIPAVLRKDEGVFTPAQMDAMGGPQSIKVSIINKSDTPLVGSVDQPKVRLDEVVLNIVLEGTARNRGGFRDNMKGALGGS